MSRPKSLVKEEIPDNVIGEISLYLAKKCGIPGCIPAIHLEESKEIIRIIVDFNKKQSKGES